MSNASIPEHDTPIKTPQQLITVAVLSFVVPVLLIVFVAHLVVGGMQVDKNSADFSEESIAKRLKPVGQVFIGTPPPTPVAAAPTAAKAEPASGDRVYQQSCGACHGAGLMGAPKLGDAVAWKARIAQGTSTLHQNALNGIRTMPARGGNSALSDAEVSAAVDYMVSKSK